MEDFVAIARQLISSPYIGLVSGSLMRYAGQPKLTFQKFACLIVRLTAKQNQPMILRSRLDILQHKVADWPARVDEILEATRMGTAARKSVGTYIDELQIMNGRIDVSFLVQITAPLISMVSDVLDFVVARPSELQRAVGAYAVGLLSKRPKQVWSLRPGTGKSRCAAMAMRAALLHTGVAHVHLVTSHVELAKR